MENLKAREITENKESLEISGVYKISCLANGKYYIGRAECFSTRFEQHIYKLNKGTHENKALQADFKKYGSDQFDFSIIQETDKYKAEELIHIGEAWEFGEQIYNVVTQKTLMTYYLIKWCRSNGYKFIIDYSTDKCVSDKGKPLVFSMIVKNKDTGKIAFISFDSAEYKANPSNMRSKEIKSQFIKQHKDFNQVIYDYNNDNLGTAYPHTLEIQKQIKKLID